MEKQNTSSDKPTFIMTDKTSPRDIKTLKTYKDIFRFLIDDSDGGMANLTVIKAIDHMTWRAIYLAAYNNSLLSVDIHKALKKAIGAYRKIRRNKRNNNSRHISHIEDRSKHEGKTECVYCNRLVNAPSSGHEQAPGADDHDTWEKISLQHNDTCEWVLTRAHQIGP